ncbi:MAG: S-layer protein [Paenibacillaceae bacterium]|nr:S-layer protein [Paenibacillaceae bacterium]
MQTFKRSKKWIMALLASTLVFSQATMAMGASIQTADTSTYTEILHMNFEDSKVSDFKGNATVTVKDDVYGKYMEVSGAAQGGTRNADMVLAAPTSSAQVLFNFDWLPGTMTPASGSNEVRFIDNSTAGLTLFRLVKTGDGNIKYDTGKTGTIAAAAPSVTNVTYGGSAWLSVQVLFDFTGETVSFEIHDKAEPARSFSNEISFSALNYSNRVKSVGLSGNRDGSNITFATGLDNLVIKTSNTPAPVQPVQNVVSIVSQTPTSKTLALKASKSEVITVLPQSVEVQLENGKVVAAPVVWDSITYNANKAGTYDFFGTLNLTNVFNVRNDNQLGLNYSITLAPVQIPEIEGFSSVLYSDMGDSVEVAPLNYGFTNNATGGIITTAVSGNTTPKYSLVVNNQSGGRAATKTFNPVTGTKILVTADWYPGTLAPKGSNPNENSAEFQVQDTANRLITTLQFTKNAPLGFFIGLRDASPKVNTGFTNMETWYAIEILLDQGNGSGLLKITDKATGVEELHPFSLPTGDNKFSGAINKVILNGVRTSGNNLTWTTYLDNLGVYIEPAPGNTIVTTVALPYKTVYVNTTSADTGSIGLPEEVPVILADERQVEAKVSKWTADKTWDPAVPGVYKFIGELDPGTELLNSFQVKTVYYVYNRLSPPESSDRQVEWLDRGLIALKAEKGTFISWRILPDEYQSGIVFNLYKNNELLNKDGPLTKTNYADTTGSAGDVYKLIALNKANLAVISTDKTTALAHDYLSIPLQKPEGGVTATGAYTYTANDAGVGDLDGDGQYEVIIKWYPTNAIDSSQSAMTGPTYFDAYQLDGTLLWRMNMGINLTSGAHYNQFVIADYDGDGKSEFMIKTADATTVYGVTGNKADTSKVISVIGDPSNQGTYLNESGHITGGPEFMSVFEGLTGKEIDTVPYPFPVGDEDNGASWGDTWYNRSDRFLAGPAYLDGVKPSAVFGRGYYERTTYVAFSLVDGKLKQEWTFDSAVAGKGGGLGYHSLATADVDNDGKDEIIAGSLTLDDNGQILYMMDGYDQRELGSHGDALHVGAFDPDREGLQVYGVHEVPAVASLEYHDAATGETLAKYYASKDTGRGLAANITSSPGYEYWATGSGTPETGSAIYNVQGGIERESNSGLSVNFALYWDGDLLHELLNGVTNDGAQIDGGTTIDKYLEQTKSVANVKTFQGVYSNNGTKATPSLQADILGDWREEVILPTVDSSELRIFSTTIPTDYTIYSLMYDPVYRNAIGWQNTAYNQPPHLGFYLGEDIKATVLANGLKAPEANYTNKPGNNDEKAILVNNVEFVDFAGHAVTSLAPSSDLVVKADVTNQGVSEQEATLVVALFNADNTMVNYSMVKWNTEPSESRTLQAGFRLPENVQGHKVKVLVWDNITSMKPLSNVEVLE